MLSSVPLCFDHFDVLLELGGIHGAFFQINFLKVMLCNLLYGHDIYLNTEVLSFIIHLSQIVPGAMGGSLEE